MKVETKKVIILDKDDDYKPNFVLEVPTSVTTDEIQEVIDKMESSLPGEYDSTDLENALYEHFHVYPETFEEVIW